MSQEIRLQALLHKIPLPEAGTTAEAAGTQKKLSPEQEARLKKHLTASRERVQSRFQGGRSE